MRPFTKVIGDHHGGSDRAMTNLRSTPYNLNRPGLVCAARALCELLAMMQALADRRGDPPLDLARVRRLLGWEDSPPIN